ncbi:MAG TPA: cysteine--tRNA ligase [Tepidisphaeraceae bacterium]|nr:cysteine--tRNA ligase [Tepidisphaeraceae bacterium]
MSLRIYNTLTRQKELFEPCRPGRVGIYLCGPTVYKSPHIGHMVGPVIFDAIKRYLVYKGFEVTWVVNITDVDDKLIDAAARAGITMSEMAEKHTAEYFDALKSLGVDAIDHFPRASEHMPEIIAMCERLVETGAAYAAGGNVWFDVAKDADYGKLSNRKVEQQEAGLRELEGAGKRNPADFALWKAAKPGEPSWESPWGKGRPGWHIECSAMSTKILGETFDLHGGGMDLMFPHHENELAQSESCTGRPFVKYWMHNGLTRVRTKSNSGDWTVDDMHESSGNAIRVHALLSRHGPELIRYLLLSTHYRRPIEFSDDALVEARKGLTAFHRLFERVERLQGGKLDDATDMDRHSAEMMQGEHEKFARDVLASKMRWLESMDDDFNTAGAIGVMHQMATEINRFIEATSLAQEKQPELVTAVAAAAITLKRLGGVLGLFRAAPAATSGGDELLGKVMSLVITLRKDARASKNFALADAIRDGLTKIGVTLEDLQGETVWRKA